MKSSSRRGARGDPLLRGKALRRFAAIAIAATLAGDAAAQSVPPSASAPPGSFRLVAALDSARALYPSLAASQARREAAHAGVGEARAAWWPQLRLQGSATQYEEPALVTPIHGFRPNLLPPFDTTLFQGQLGASWMLFDGGARSARVRAARREEDAAIASFAGSEQDLALQVVNDYLTVLTGRSVLESADLRLEALAAESDRVRKLRAAGRAAEVEVLRVDASQAAAVAERVRLAAVLDLAERDLARITGVQLESTRATRLVPVALADTLPIDRDALYTAARAANLDLVQAQARYEVANASLSLARSGRWPELRAAGAYNGWADDEGHDALEWNAGLQLSYPLFTGGAVSKGIERAAANERAAGKGLQLVELEVIEDVDRGLAVLEQSHARVQSLATAVARGTEVARIEHLSLAAGAGTQTDYLRAEADLQDARAAYAEARHGEMAARAALARLTGVLDAAWIARTLEDRP